MVHEFSMPVVDMHSHVIADDAARFPTAPMGGKQSDWSKERPVNIAGMLSAMYKAGVAKSVLVQASTCYGHDNAYVAEAVRLHPDRFIGVYSVDFMAPDALANIERWQQQGLSGVRVFIAGHSAADRSIRLDDPRAFAAWEHIGERSIPICIQIRSDGLAQVKALLQRFPKVKVLLDHFARPLLEEGAPYTASKALFELAAFDNLYVKFTTHNVRESAQGQSSQAAFCRAVVNVFGAHRIAWGSNFPASSGHLSVHLGEAMQATADLTNGEREWIFCRTAHALYPDLGLADAYTCQGVAGART